jgi:NTE family protein
MSNDFSSIDPCNPVAERADKVPHLEDGSALCLSGGGYRAMLFHVGTLWRLYEAGVLRSMKRISSVSGGSISAAVLALNWDDLFAREENQPARFERLIVAPLREMAEETIDSFGVIGGIFLPGMIADKIQASYKKHLFGDKTLQDFPAEPRFILNATNVQSGALWRFSKPYMRDYRVGEVKNPTIPVAAAVAASSAFPPVLSPMIMKLDPTSFTPDSGDDL